MSMLKKLHLFHQTRTGYLTFGVVELILAYICASIAIDSASMWSYLATIVLAVGVVFNMIGFFTSASVHKQGKRKSKNAHGSRA